MELKEGIIIIEDEEKESILSSLTSLKDYKFINLKEFLELLTFKVQERGALFIANKYKMPLENAYEFIDLLKYDKLFIDHPKLNYLKQIKFDLKDYIIVNEAFINSLKHKNITFYHLMDNQDLKYAFKLLDELEIKYEIIAEDFSIENINHDVYAFNDIEDEVRFVFAKIKNLLDNNLPLDKIKIANYSSEYDFCFHKSMNFYQIPINFPAPKNILSTDIATFIIEHLNDFETIKEVSDYLKLNYQGNQYLNKIINIFNAYHLFNEKPITLKEVLIYEMKKIPYEQIHYEHSIDIIDFMKYKVKEDEQIFVLGFNLLSLPRIEKNTTYIDDDLAKQISLDTSFDRNEQNKKYTIYRLKQKNLTITYKLNSTLNKYLPSLLIKELKYNVIESDIIEGINEKEDRLIYGTYLDNYRKFREGKNLLSRIYDISYLKFDNSYKYILPSIFEKYFNKNFTTSYSSLKNYFECPFKYYLISVLKLNTYETTIQTYIGNYLHYILQHLYDTDFDYEKTKKTALISNEIPSNDPKIMFFINILDKPIKQLIEFNKEKEKQLILDQHYLEKNISKTLFSNKLTITGKIDKIMYTDIKGEIYYIIVDYKTGNDKIDLSNIDIGFNLQLPTYYYLIESSALFSKPSHLLGFYLQKLNLFENNFKLDGYSHENIYQYINNEYINYKVNKDGNYNKKTKIFNSQEQQDILSLAENKIKEAYEKIIAGQFEIAPKVINGEKLSCLYCKFADVCFHQERDNVKINKKKSGGNNDEFLS